MATDPKERKDWEQAREAGAEQLPEEKVDNEDSGRNGLPGYGQPPQEVRKHLPEQKW